MVLYRYVKVFQHTAARRRLQDELEEKIRALDVSTHSRAEAAAAVMKSRTKRKRGFNTQPRGGGCTGNGYL